MPEGLEQGMDRQGMADLLAYLIARLNGERSGSNSSWIARANFNTADPGGAAWGAKSA